MPSKKMSGKEKMGHVLRYLKRNRLMTLGTSAGNKPWAATVFFAYDRNANILFYSREDTRHCLHIRKNPFVSVAVNHDWGEKSGLIRGLQVTGRARKPAGRERDRLYKIYKARFRWADEFASDHVLYVIKPLEIWQIDQKLFGHFQRVRMK